MELYEVHIPVSDIAQSIAFYRDIVGLELAYEVPERSVAFMWIGKKERSMLGIWGPDSLYGWKGDQRFGSHFAIQIPLDELLKTPERLQKLGITPVGFGDLPGTEPSVIGWMPSAQIYFRDPDDHSLEYITFLDQAPHADFIGTWTEWQALTDR
ncbi:MAG: VOC family protein [Chloroflexota bacterium]